MNNIKYKLKRIKKKGIAIGLSLVIALSLTACIPHHRNNTYNTPSNSQSQSTIQVTSDYIDVLRSNELKTYDSNKDTLNITLNSTDYLNFQNSLGSYDYTFSMAPYYGIDEAMGVYKNTQINKNNSQELLTNGKLDKSKLMAIVKENNKAYMAKGKDAINTFYTDISEADLDFICTQIVEVTNSQYNDIEIAKVADTLTKLTVFEKKGAASNAYVTNDLTFVYNPTMTNMYGDMQEITGTTINKGDTKKSVVVHEIMHLLEYSVNDNNDSNGIESGICRMYNVPNQDSKVPVDSLWNSWLLEAAAELGMSEYLNVKPGTYAKKISYVRSYNISRFNDLNLENQSLEDSVFDATLEKSYQRLGLTTEEEQREFQNFLYSVEITQTDPNDFWENYKNKTGKSPTDQEKLAIRMEIREDAVKFLSKNFYSNLADSIYEGKIKDLDSAFYLIRTWELDAYSHLEYTKSNSLPYAEDFIKWQHNVHQDLFTALASSNNLTTNEISTMYDDYNLQVSTDNQTSNNCHITAYNTYTNNYLLSAKENYTTSNFSRNKDVYEYITSSENKGTEKKTESTPQIEGTTQK